MDVIETYKDWTVTYLGSSEREIDGEIYVSKSNTWEVKLVRGQQLVYKMILSRDEMHDLYTALRPDD